MCAKGGSMTDEEFFGLQDRPAEMSMHTGNGNNRCFEAAKKRLAERVGKLFEKGVRTSMARTFNITQG